MQRQEPYAACSSVNVGGNKRRFFCTYCITFNQQLPGPPAQQVFWISFFPPSMRTMGCKKKKSFGKGAGQISSNCLVIGKWFSFLTIFLAG